jgi:NAD-dependent deacetylase
MVDPAPFIESEISRAADIVRSSQAGVCLTGAGISTRSGIPDFRSAGSGLWTRYNPLEVASLSAFRYHPNRFFAWMRPLLQQIISASPNPAHLSLAQLQQAGHIRTIITQNIDGLHHKARSTLVLEVHGSLQTLTCIGCFRQVDSAEFIQPLVDTGEIPRCLDCHNILKPDVVLFEEQLPFITWQQAEAACHDCDFMLVAGSSLEVMPVAGLPMHALENHASLIVVNQTPTYIDPRADVLIQGDVAEVLPLLAAEVLR